MTSVLSPTTLYLTLWSLGCAAGFTAGVLVLRARRALDLRSVAALGFAWEGLLIGSKWHFRLETMPVWDALVLSPADLFAPGRRLPLGLLIGGVLAAVWCFASRTPWRAVGDALAVAASVLIPIGRLGCLASGCCMGGVCAPWSAHVCWRFPPGSEAYSQQLRDGVIRFDAALSLPAHPLPLYFALASLCTLGILVWQLRRGAPAGTLLATFCVLRPAAKLALEPLRATPAVSVLMVGIPLSVVLLTLGVLGARAVRRLALARPQRRIAVLFAALLAAGTARAEDAAMPEPCSKALGTYAMDPAKGRRALRALRREGIENLPPIVLMAMADARLRSGNRRAAARLFREVLSRAPGEPWVGWASLGLGWISMAARDHDDARDRFAAVAASESPSRALASVVLGLLEAEAGRTEEATEVLARVSDAPDVSPGLRQTASLGTGYALYWAGRYGDAAARFDEAASSGLLRDDARYAAAISRWRLGQHVEAKAALQELATLPASRSDDRFPPALLRLERAALLREGLARYRHAPFRPPEEHAAALLDHDGGALARAALRTLVESSPDGRRTNIAKIETAPAPGEVARVATTAAPAAVAAAATAPPKRSSSRRAWNAALFFLVLAAVAAGIRAWAHRPGTTGDQRHARPLR